MGPTLVLCDRPSRQQDQHHDLLATDPRRRDLRHRDRPVPRRAGRTARRRRARLRPAAADDRVAVRDGLDHPQPRQPRPGRGEAAGPAGRGDDRRPVGRRPRLRVPGPAGVPPGRERVVLQRRAGRDRRALQFHRSLHSIQSLQLAGQQRRPGGGPLRGAPGRGAHRHRAQGGAPRRARRRQRDHFARNALRQPADAVRDLCAGRERRRHPAGRRPPAHRGLPDCLHRDGAAGCAVGAAGAGRGADADSVSGGARPDPRCPDHRLQCRRSLHRAAEPDRGVQDAAGASRRHRRSDDRAARRDRAGVVQLSAHRQAAVAELHHVRWLVRRLAGAACSTIRGSRSPDC